MGSLGYALGGYGDAFAGICVEGGLVTMAVTMAESRAFGVFFAGF